MYHFFSKRPSNKCSPSLMGREDWARAFQQEDQLHHRPRNRIGFGLLRHLQYRFFALSCYSMVSMKNIYRHLNNVFALGSCVCIIFFGGASRSFQTGGPLASQPTHSDLVRAHATSPKSFPRPVWLSHCLQDVICKYLIIIFAFGLCACSFSSVS